VEGKPALVAALIKAKAEFNPARKSSVNPHFKNRYADLAEVIEATEPALLKHGLVVLQPTRVDEQGRVILQTILLHESGEREVGEYLLVPSKQDPQGYGAAMTYARRYCWKGILGIAEEDDDGESASGRGESRGNPAAKGRGPRRPSSPDQVTTTTTLTQGNGALPPSVSVDMADELYSLMEKAGYDVDAFLDKHNLTTLRALRPEEYVKARAKCEQKIAGAGK